MDFYFDKNACSVFAYLYRIVEVCVAAKGVMRFLCVASAAHFFICIAFGEEVGVIKVAEYHFDGAVVSIYDDYITDDEEVKALAKKRMAAALGRFHARRQREEYEKWLAEQKRLEAEKENANE